MLKHILLGISGLAMTTPAAAVTFSFSNSIVDWTAATSGTYRVTAIGAQGVSANTGFAGGRGAKIAGTFTFAAGQMFKVAVGGAANSSFGPGQFNGGGGGGTFFVSASDTPLLVAGGGGGTRREAQQNGTDASITAFGFTASGFSSSYTPVLKTTGLGQGGSVSSGSWGSAGAGFFSDGASDLPYGEGGRSWANGLAGGLDLDFRPGTCSDGDGGFGGGGAGAGCGGGGGGGGYSGGDGGHIAGGGGSWNTGSDAFAEAGVGFGNGSLTIDLVNAVPEPATWAMMIAGFGMVGSAARRRSKTAVTYA